ncbi:hypothetical protein JCM19296_470 [Nonlabens ulvanivorans]|uniref:Uncharacterized protein n=1 Tax=Nonlabens ulvanivorans TaxID=906888 RepID=A0A081D7J6_NONUL|nr:hypothetical protein JCM19296_470 [Nonlabens ulvanivorans]
MEGIVLVESRFRESLKNTDFTAYKDHYVAVNALQTPLYLNGHGC